ncbi:hypothetical protein [Asanoa iriomotensis]|uniref:PASTA domain-containing protein n=1 Tax=Asanoa iriomotensis TaxID=234613 RepID=A0ABQ4BW23_9ACTN|nr:hypothetical protein [Asanoa iriomotensis]GIF54250.1 hypothetical protein Air01nite_03450 [Asanoa iriomotensis]
MLETDRVRDAFTDLTDSIDPFLRPPGVESVHTTVRRRRQRRLGVTAAAAVAVAAVAGLAQLPAMEQPAPVVADQPAPADTLAPTAGAPSPAPPSMGTASAGGPSAAVTRTPGRGQDAGGPRTGRPTEPAMPPPACASTVSATANGSNLVIAADVICPGETIAVSWVTYEARRDGSQQLFANERLTLTEAQDRVTATLRESPTCVGPWYVLRDDPAIPATIAAEESKPFPAGTVVASEDGEICLS